jgi:hypothetical protein
LSFEHPENFAAVGVHATTLRVSSLCSLVVEVVSKSIASGYGVWVIVIDSNCV